MFYEDISEYRSETGCVASEAPAGYVFAGWFTDKDLATFIGKNETEQQTAYAKFVDEKLLGVKAQATAETTTE